MTVQDYIDLIPSANADQPDFLATLSAVLQGPVQVQYLLDQMIPLFDVDNARGQQLDVIGLWVGISRDVKVPISGVYFAWDDPDPFVGWDYGVWQPGDAPTDVTALPDDQYRLLIKAKIAANQWDGTTNGAYAIWDTIFTTVTILIQDHQDMSYDLAIVGGVIDSLTLALITGGYIPLKPESVRVNEYLVSIDTGPAFAWDLDTTLLKGWDEGEWLRELAPT